MPLRASRRLAGLVTGVLLSAAPLRAADPIVELLFWDTIGDTATAGLNAYQNLQKERALWASETARLTSELDACDGCADEQRLRSELDGWTRTEQDYQTIVGSVLSQGGYDATVQRFFGVANPGSVGTLQATGQKDYINYDAIPDPDWLLTAGPFCQATYNQKMRCLKAGQAAGWRDETICDDVSRLESYCADGDTTRALDFANILNLRKAGVLIPDVEDAGGDLRVDYGRVDAPVGPRVAGGAEVARYFADTPDRLSVIYRFHRGAQAGLLERAAYKRFSALNFTDYRQACPVSAREGEPAQCAPFRDRRHDPAGDGYQAPVVLECDYAAPGSSQTNRFRFWLSSRPGFAASARPVSAEIAAMRVAGFCPVSYADAAALAGGRLSPERLAEADYTVPFSAIATDRTGSRTPEEMIEAMRSYSAEVIEAGFGAPEAGAEDGAGTDSRETPRGPVEIDAAWLGLDDRGAGSGELGLLGLSLGMSRAEAEAIIATKMPDPAVVMERSAVVGGRAPLFLHGLHHVGPEGRAVTVYFDRAGAEGRVLAVVSLVPDRPTIQDHFLALRRIAQREFSAEITEKTYGADILFTGPLRQWPVCLPGDNQMGPLRIAREDTVVWHRGEEQARPNLAELKQSFRKTEAEKAATCGPTVILRRGYAHTSASLVDVAAAYRVYQAALDQ